MNFSKTLLIVAALAATSLTSLAQTVTPRPSTPPAGSGLSADIRALALEHRTEMKALMEQRKALIEKLRAATPETREAFRAALRQLMISQQQQQRELAKSIRDAIRAKRDERRQTPTG
jgi:hypothetical protein